MIEISSLTVTAGAFALRDISFVVPRGAYAVLMGRTGTGKTTLLEAICGLKTVEAGRISLAGREVTGLKAARGALRRFSFFPFLRRNVTGLKAAERGIGFVPQDGALFRSMTVREHLEFALYIRRWPRPQIARRVDDLARMVGLGPLLLRPVYNLSGGESQRVALGRALSFQPEILCLDEPLSALDDESRQEIIALLKKIQRDTGVTALHVTHNRQEAESLADLRLCLQNGAIAVET